MAATWPTATAATWPTTTERESSRRLKYRPTTIAVRAAADFTTAAFDLCSAATVRPATTAYTAAVGTATTVGSTPATATTAAAEYEWPAAAAAVIVGSEGQGHRARSHAE